MAIPNFETIMEPLLRQISDGKGYTRGELTKLLAKHFKLSPKEANTMLPCGKESVLNNRVGWANFHLKQAGLTENKTRGVITITEEGLNALKTGKIDKNFLKSCPTYRRNTQKR
ncbi:winged helix-turn-helix domain-containing protein [Methanobacterium formicicum]|uniref:Winged helix-turn-helix domain-containing protein n=1 Tax=Methanobacterium formicicum TaxID=2162 RepID=A0A843ALB9_METFO|nr:winged helix-turn-helix domain-containing protein [Methanobacterium formicicum]MBF4473930.1 winged helix-turn-helix domain-containing protein [Methanobacterium formicicum]